MRKRKERFPVDREGDPTGEPPERCCRPGQAPASLTAQGPALPRGSCLEVLPWVCGATRRFLGACKRFISPQKGVNLDPSLSQVRRRRTFELVSPSPKAKYCICTQKKLYPLWLQRGWLGGLEAEAAQI